MSRDCSLAPQVGISPVGVDLDEALTKKDREETPASEWPRSSGCIFLNGPAGRLQMQAPATIGSATKKRVAALAFVASVIAVGHVAAQLRIPVNVTTDSGNVTGIPLIVTAGRCCAF